MEKNGREFLGLVCGLYMTVLLAVLPLYTGQGYWQLGEMKYLLFRNVSVLCLGVWLVLSLFLIRRRTWRGLSAVDAAVLAYGLCVLLSAAFSEYAGTELPWQGWEGWHMGAFSRLGLAAVYFFVSRQYSGSRYPLYLGEAALGAVTALGLLHRLGIDPLGLLAPYNPGDWEYTHMISTIGNINWLCGFYSAALALPLAHYLREKRKGAVAALYVLNTAAFFLLLIQGSYSGLLIPAAAAAVCFFLPEKAPERLGRMLRLAAGAMLLMPVWQVLMKIAGEKAVVAADGNLFAVTVWQGWAAAGLGCLFISVLCPGLSEKTVRRAGLALGILGAAAVLAWGGELVAAGGPGDAFGSGRGYLWRISLQSFREADFRQKLLGAGPDCFGRAVFERYTGSRTVWQGTHWENAIFTNAHCELLTHLTEVGLLGTAAYLMIFAAAFRRYRRLPLGQLVLAMYGVYSFVSFQQVLSTPILFLTLGICERSLAGAEVIFDRRLGTVYNLGKKNQGVML